MVDDRNIKVDYLTLESGDVMETIDIFGDVQTRFYRLRALSREKAIRDALIALGWTPPPEDYPT